MTEDIQLKEIRRLISKMVRVESGERIDVLNKEISELRETKYSLEARVRKLEKIIESLERAVRGKRGVDITSEEIIENIGSFVDETLKIAPKKDWHCSNVWNFAQESDYVRKFQDYAETQNQSIVGIQMANLVRLVLRFERECETVDSNIMRFCGQTVANNLGLHRSAGYMGMDFYDCEVTKTRCTKLQEIFEKMVRDEKKKESVPVERYPKVRVSA